MGDERTLPYVPSIDGLRGAAVLLVLAFHADVPGTSGGFLGVSVFFTLSGYLITQLLVAEHHAHGSISLRRFWGRRLRRLAPASLAALTAIAVLVMTTHVFPGPAVPGDVVAAVADVANWRFVVAQTSYEDLFASGPSPVLHFWSLAIEEQFYLLFPIVVALVLRRWGRRRLPHALGGLIVLGTIAAIVSPQDIAYYGTHARAPELLVGALLALALPIGHASSPARGRVIAGLGVMGAVILGLLVASTQVSSGWLYDGGLPAVSLASAAVIAAATVPGPVRRAAGWAPAVATGRMSYGIYVYHWPLFLLLTEERLGFGGAPLLVVRLAATFAVALASGVLLEDPVRRRALLRRADGAAAAFGGAVAVVLAVALVASPASAPDLVPSGDEVLALSHSQPRVTDVAVLGSVPEVEDWVRGAVPGRADVRVRPAARPRPSFADQAAEVRSSSPDLVVVGIGERERAPITEMLDRVPVEDRASVAVRSAALQMSRHVLDEMVASLPPSVPVLIVDTKADELFTSQLQELRLSSDRLFVSLAADGLALRDDLSTVLDEVGQDSRLRVLVLGDSTSLQLAKALDAVGGDQVRVLWAGKGGCGLVPSVRARWLPDLDIDTSVCPTVRDRWPDAVEELHPDVVLAAASLGELAEQQYADGGPWTVPGEAPYIAAHDTWMRDLQALLRDAGALTIVATVPPLLHGTHFDGPVAEPERLTGWLDQIDRWDAAWASVGVLDWAAITAAAEAGAGHPLREDAVHFAAEPLLTVLAPPLLAHLLDAYAALEASARRDGCLVGTSLQPRLDLARCAAA